MKQKRSGFTLMELLVVLALIALLGALLAFVMPGFRDRQRAARGGMALQGWLNYARQRALLEQAPRGVRLLFATKPFATSHFQMPAIPANAGQTTIAVVEQCQYLETPDEYFNAAFSVFPDPLNTTNPARVRIGPAVPPPSDFADGTIEIGDRLEIKGLTYGIIDMSSSDPPAAPLRRDVFQLASLLPTAVDAGGISQYRVIRRPRVTGDDAMKLPNGIVIDLQSMQSAWASLGGSYAGINPTSLATNTAPGQGYIDLMFGPTGALLQTGGDKVVLWVRAEPPDGLPNDPFANNPSLIVVYTRTGAVEAYDPVNAPNPYAKVR